MKRFKIVTLITLMTLATQSTFAEVSNYSCHREGIRVKEVTQNGNKLRYLSCNCNGKMLYKHISGAIMPGDYQGLMSVCPNKETTIGSDSYHSYYTGEGENKEKPSEEYFTSTNAQALKDGKAQPFIKDVNTDEWKVDPSLRAKGTNGNSIGDYEADELEKFKDSANDYNADLAKYKSKIASAEEYKKKKTDNDLAKKTASFDEAIEKANGDYNDAYAMRRNDLIYKYEQVCVAHQTIKKQDSNNPNKDAALSTFGYPGTEDIQTAVAKVNADKKGLIETNPLEVPLYSPSAEDESPKEFTGNGCEAWATFQATNGDELVAARKNVIDEDNAVQMSYDANGTPSEDNPQIQKDVKEQLAEAFEYSYCSTSVFSERYVDKSFDYTKEKGEPGKVVDYTIAFEDSASGFDPGFPDPEFRRIPKPASCIHEEKNYITNQDFSYYTDYTDTTAALLTPKGKKRVCEGALFQRDENGVACNDLFKAAQSCNDEDSPFISESPATKVIFEDHKFAQIINTYLQSVNANENSNQTANTLTFGEKEHCQQFMINKFKQCIGTAYSKIDIDTEAAESVTPTKSHADEESVALAKTKLAKEMGLQFGTCIAFRKLSQEIANDLGESWAQPGQTHASADGRVLCQRIAPWTLDYKACKNLADTQSGFMVGDMARNVGGQGWSMVRQNQIRNESQDQMMGANQNGTLKPGDEGYISPQENQVNVALDSQKKMYEHQKNKETMNLGFHAAQAGTLTTLLSTYPTPNKIGRQSEDHPYLSTIIDASERFSGVKAQLFANQEQRKKMWGQVMESAASATLAALKAAQYKKMANDVQTYKKAFNDLNKDATNSSSTLEVGYCSLNPTAPGCTNTGPRMMGNSQFSYGSIGAQNASGGAIDFNNDEGNLGAFDEAELTQSQQTAIDDLGSVIDRDSAGSFGSGIEKKVGAGKFSRSPASGGGGGGGGGAGGGGSAYNGGGAGGGAGGNNSAFGGAKQKVSYGAGSGRIKYSGSGSGSSKKSSNPFSSLFGKKKGRKVASKVTNDIAPSHSGLFDKISKRYSKMQQADRLHKLK
jgi:hypothetical protein